MRTYFAITRRNEGTFEMLMGMTTQAESREEATAKITEEWIVNFNEAAFVDFICEIPQTSSVQCVFSMYLDAMEIHPQAVGKGHSVSYDIWCSSHRNDKISKVNEFLKL